MSAESATLLVELQVTTSTKQAILTDPNKNSPNRSTTIFSNKADDPFSGEVQEAPRDCYHSHGDNRDQSLEVRDNTAFESGEPRLQGTEVQARLPENDYLIDFQGLDDEVFGWSWAATEEDGFLQSVTTAPFASGIELADINNHETRQPDNSTKQDDSSEDESEEEIIEQLSIRLGDLQVVDDGTLRYFGPTSNMTLSPAGMLHNSRQVLQLNMPQNYVRSENFVSWMHFDHLSNLYFCWQNSFLPVVDRKVFEDSLNLLNEGQEVTFCSEPLKLSM